MPCFHDVKWEELLKIQRLHGQMKLILTERWQRSKSIQLTFSGQPQTENGKRDDENQVSKTSSSWLMLSEWLPKWAEAYSVASFKLWAATHFSTLSPCWDSRYAGMRWPHHNWREMHQSLIFSSQSNQTFSKLFGWILRWPLVTAMAARWAISLVLTNHWGRNNGSTMSPDRLQIGTLIWWGEIRINKPVSFKKSTIFSLTSNRGKFCRDSPISRKFTK